MGRRPNPRRRLERLTYATILGVAALAAGAPVAGTVTTYASPAGLSNTAGGIAVDVEGNVYSADFGGTTTIKIALDGTITTFATNLLTPSGNAFDSKGNLYQSNYADQNNQNAPDTITMVAPDGTASTFVGGLNGPVGIAIDGDDTLFVAMCNSNNVTRIPQGGPTTTFATSSLFACPNGITFDERGDIYVVNFNNGDVLLVTPDGQVSRFATIPGGGNGHVAYVAGDLYVADRNGNQIFKVGVPSGNVSLLAGTGTAGSADGPNLQAQFNLPNAIERNREGSVLYTNGFANLVRRIELNLKRPKKPKKVKAKAKSKKKVRLEWKHTSLNREGFSILLATDNTDFEKVAEVGPTKSSITLKRLIPQTRYHLRVEVFNGTKSRKSKTVKVVTK